MCLDARWLSVRHLTRQYSGIDIVGIVESPNPILALARRVLLFLLQILDGLFQAVTNCIWISSLDKGHRSLGLVVPQEVGVLHLFVRVVLLLLSLALVTWSIGNVLISFHSIRFK